MSGVGTSGDYTRNLALDYLVYPTHYLLGLPGHPAGCVPARRATPGVQVSTAPTPLRSSTISLGVRKSIHSCDNFGHDLESRLLMSIAVARRRSDRTCWY